MDCTRGVPLQSSSLNSTTSRGGPQAFKVLPVVVYRVYPDGRPDELVRGVDIVGTPLSCFSKIICTGDEVLTGKTVNTNYSHMARRLQEVGLDVARGTTVGDDRAALLDAFHLAAGRVDAVIVNGGLGPTVDDLSQEVAAPCGCSSC